MAPVHHDIDLEARPSQLAEAHRALSEYRARSAGRVPLYFVLIVLGALTMGVAATEIFHELGAGHSLIWALSLLLTGGVAAGSGSTLLVRSARRIRQLEQMISRLGARLLS